MCAPSLDGYGIVLVARRGVKIWVGFIRKIKRGDKDETQCASGVGVFVVRRWGEFVTYDGCRNGKEMWRAEQGSMHMTNTPTCPAR